MSTLQDMETFVLNDPAVAAMIKSFTPITLPQHPVYPAATYFQVDRAHEHTMEGLETVHPRIQIDCYGQTYADANKLCKVIDDCFGRWKDTFGDAAFGENRMDIPEPEMLHFRKKLDVVIWGLES